jgi:hypothetical protein
MCGYLRSTDALFRRQAYTGVESTFGVGGPWDGPNLDGAVWQWQDLGHQADAQGPGNAYATSVETSDGGHPEPWTDRDGVRHPANPWSARQLDALVRLTVWWCQQTGHPARLVTSTSDTGIGYHRQFSAWNAQNHSCPGNTRLKQLLDYVIPTAAVRLERPHTTPTPIPLEDDMPLTAADIDLMFRSGTGPGTARYQIKDGDDLIGLTEAANRILWLVRRQAERPAVDVTELAAAVVKALPGGGAGTDTSQITVTSIVDELLKKMGS